jgi:hypothetical protein
VVYAAYFPVGWAEQRAVAVEAAGPIAVVGARSIAVAAEAHPIAGFAADTVEDTGRLSTGPDLLADRPVKGNLEVVDNLAAVGLDSLGLDSLAGGGRQTMGL